MRMKRWLGILLAVMMLAAALAGCSLLPAEEEELEAPVIGDIAVTYKTVKVERGDLETKVTLPANFESSKMQDCFFEERGGYLDGIFVNKGDMVEEGQVLAQLDTADLEYEKEQLHYAYLKADLNYKRTKENGGDSYSVKIAEYDRALAKMAYDKVVKELDLATITAPISGQITYVAKIMPGDYVNAYTDIIRISDPTSLDLVVEGTQAREARAGMEVIVKYDNKEYKGVVTSTPSDVPEDAVQEDTDKAYISVEGLPAGVSMGDSVTVTRVTASSKGVLMLPSNAVSNFSGRYYVMVLDSNGIKVEKDVEVGITTSTKVEIVDGLEEGEEVIVS